MLKYLFAPLLFACLLLAACDTDEPTIRTEVDPDESDGEVLITYFSPLSAEVAFARIDSAVASNNQVGIVARIDHAANASSAGLSLPPTRLVLFGNPRLGTPLMQESQTVGIDLPQKMLVWENERGASLVTYNPPLYLARRHGISGIEDTTSALRKIDRALQTIALEAEVFITSPDEDGSAISLREGLIQVESNFSVDETFSRLEQAVEDAAPLTIMARLDHAANAQRVGLSLRPTKLLVFGNPNLGTPLMQSARTIAIDLPQKVLVYQAADSTVFLAYNDPHYLATRHGIQGQDSTLATISGALQNLANAATR